jgi:Tudor domain
LPNEKQNVSIQKRDRVNLTALINEKCVFIKRLEDDLNFLLEEIYRNSKNVHPIDKIPDVGENVLIKAFDSIFRAKVLKYKGESSEGFRFIVQLLDIGNTCCVKLEDIFEMPNEIADMDVLAKKVYLKNVNLHTINHNVIIYLLTLLENETELIVKSIDEGGHVELMDNTNNKIINDEIMRLNENLNDIFEYLHLTFDTFTLGPNKNLFVVNASLLEDMGIVMCVDEKYLRDFYEFYKSLNAYGEKLDEANYVSKCK